MKNVRAMIVLSTAYVLSINAVNAAWDTNTAAMLATASDCAYKLTSENRKREDREEVLGCLTRAAPHKKSFGGAFSGLDLHSVEVFYSPDDNAHEINAAILVKIPNGAVIAFRGTEPDKSDWLNNFKLFRPDDLDEGTRELLYEKGRHAGFERSLQSLRTKILQNSSIWQPFVNQAEATLYLTGHSKGGALATGATVDFRQPDFSGDVVTYTFAAPRFFTAYGKKNSENSIPGVFDNLWRFEYQYDFVPHVPLGKVTHDILLERLDQIPGKLLPEKISRLKELLRSLVQNNNVNFVPVGKLMYANYQSELCDENLSASYPQRFKDVASRLASRVLELIQHPSEAIEIVKNPAKNSFFIEQHAQYLPYLKEQSSIQACMALSR